MRISELVLEDFRSYAHGELTLQPGPTVLVGFNGVGKTNVAEAVGYLATLSSHRVTQDAPLVRHGADQAFIRAQAHRGSQSAFLEVEINPGRANRARINRGAPVRAADMVGILRSVLFAPEDLELIKGSPAIRRRMADDLAVQLRPAHASLRQDYEKVLKQRNALLKSMRHERPTPTHDSTLEVWDHQLATIGGALLRARLDAVGALTPHTGQAYHELSDSVRAATMRYIPAFSAEESSTTGAESTEEVAEFLAHADAAALSEHLLQGLGNARRRERERGITLVGPHRDELAFSLDETPVKGYASHGETWSYALALRLAAYRTLIDDDPQPGAEPILILDDVFAELDARRRQRLAHLATGAEQLLITAAVDDDVPSHLLAHSYRVDSVDQLSQISVHQEPRTVAHPDAGTHLGSNAEESSA